MTLTPEQKARIRIDAALSEAGWLIQDRSAMNLSAGRGVAVREFKMIPGHGFADYLLFVDGKAVGALEAKPEGYPLINVELQVDKYAHGLPAGLNPPVDPLPFQYLSTGVETRLPEDHLQGHLGESARPDPGLPQSIRAADRRHCRHGGHGDGYQADRDCDVHAR